MNTHEPDFLLSLKLWWAYFWRSTLCALLVSVIGGIVIGIIFVSIEHFLNTDFDAAGSLAAGAIGAVLGAIVSILVMQRLMKKGFGKYRLMVVDR